NLKIEKVRTGRIITNLIFSWEHQKRELESKEDIHIEVSENGIEQQVIKIKVISKDDKVQENKELENENSLFQIFSNMTDNLQEIILEQAKEMYMQDVNIDKMIPMHERFFRVAQKQYILKVLNKKHKEN
ncbi:MAG: hypothetical protein ACRC0G_09790, partial [Fusobacteriaceae bacterium]